MTIAGLHVVSALIGLVLGYLFGKGFFSGFLGRAG